MLETKFIKVKSKKYGDMVACYNPIKDMICNGYLIHAIKKGRRLTGYIDIYENLIIDLDKMKFAYYMCTKSQNDVCLTFKLCNKNYRAFHVKKRGNKQILVMKTNPAQSICANPISEVNDYWMLEYGDENIKYAIYDIRVCRVKTAVFDDIKVIRDNDIHQFFFKKDLCGIIDGEELYVTTLCGYLDKECMLSSNILDTELGSNAYSAYLYKNTISKKFIDLCANRIATRSTEFINKRANNDSIINYMGYHPVIYDKKQEAKIYKFTRKND